MGDLHIEALLLFRRYHYPKDKTARDGEALFEKCQTLVIARGRFDVSSL